MLIMHLSYYSLALAHTTLALQNLANQMAACFHKVRIGLANNKLIRLVGGRCFQLLG